MNKSAIRELTFKLLYSLDVQKSYEDEDIELYLEDTEVNSEQVINQVKEDIKNIIENTDLLEKQISSNEISNLKDMEIKNKTDFEKVANLLEYRYAKTYTNFAPHEYVVENEEGEKLEIIRKLNKFIQENYDEIEIFAKKEYKVLFVGKHKYWSMGKWDETNILNRNWDFKNEDGTTNTSITYSYLGN